MTNTLHHIWNAHFNQVKKQKQINDWTEIAVKHFMIKPQKTQFFHPCSQWPLKDVTELYITYVYVTN